MNFRRREIRPSPTTPQNLSAVKGDYYLQKPTAKVALSCPQTKSLFKWQKHIAHLKFFGGGGLHPSQFICIRSTKVASLISRKPRIAENPVCTEPLTVICIASLKIRDMTVYYKIFVKRFRVDHNKVHELIIDALISLNLAGLSEMKMLFSRDDSVKLCR